MVGSITKTTVEDTVEALSNADSVILVVGYGMAVAKAQYAISDICAMLRAKGITVRFAIHPVAGVSLLHLCTTPFTHGSCSSACQVNSASDSTVQH
jgi:NAD/NADP transhydrogenase beta subunit